MIKVNVGVTDEFLKHVDPNLKYFIFEGENDNEVILADIINKKLLRLTNLEKIPELVEMLKGKDIISGMKLYDAYFLMKSS